MDVQVIMLGGLVSTMLVFALALAIAWRRFGRQRHVALWAAAFLFAAIGNLSAVVRMLLPQIALIQALVATAASIACPTLFAIGFRWRAGLTRWRPAIAGAACAAAAGFAFCLWWPAAHFHRVVGCGYAAIAFAVAARALAEGRRDRPGADRAACWLVSLLSVYFAALLPLAIVTGPARLWSETVYRAAYLLGAPTGMAGLGLFAMLLIASDLSDRLQKLASLDPLTGVLNRRGIDHAATRLLSRCRRTERPFTVVVADLDRFKSINDRFGHALGDLVLQRFARHCETMVREGDLVGRLGGEEFVIVMADANARAAAEATERLRAELPIAIAELDLPAVVTASFGIATLGDRTDTLSAMLVRADAALYGSKGDGRDRISFAPVGTAAHGATDPRFLAAFARGEDDRGENDEAVREPVTAQPAYGRRS